MLCRAIADEQHLEVRAQAVEDALIVDRCAIGKRGWNLRHGAACTPCRRRSFKFRHDRMFKHFGVSDLMRTQIEPEFRIAADNDQSHGQ